MNLSVFVLLVMCVRLHATGHEHNVVSRNKPVKQSSFTRSFPARFCVDGDVNTLCSTMNDKATTVVDLLGMYRVDSVVLHNRGDEFAGRLVGAVVELLSRRNVVLHSCGTVMDTKHVYNLSCDNRYAEKVQVRHSRDEFLQFTELEVISNGPNFIVSTRKPSRMTNPQLYFPSFNCADGDIQTPCSTTLSDNPSWTVHLQGLFQVDSVLLYNRVDSEQQTIVGALIELLTGDDRVLHSCGTIPDSKVFYTIPCNNHSAEMVRIRLPRRDTLHFSELEVVGEPVEEHF